MPILPLLFLLLLCFSVTGQEPTEILTIVDPKSNLNQTHLAIAVSDQDLNYVADSVLMAETWLRTHVLTHYPTIKITHIVVGHRLLCSSLYSHHYPSLHTILPSIQNIHHSLIRWGLDTHIKVSPSLSSHCLTPNLTHSLIKPLVQFIQFTNSTYLVNPSHNTEPISSISTHVQHLKTVGFSSIMKVNLVVETPKETISKITRRLGEIVVPPLPTQSPESSPANNFPIADGSLPPLVGPIPSPPSPIPVPHIGLAPAHSPHHHHHPHILPPCNPWTSIPSPPPATPGPSQGPVPVQKVWCVAKPSVPAETLQEAVDYACGEGGADCDEIQPYGNCYFPDTVVAHASYAFNSYWQKTKRNGGTCSFGGTAMLINSDPSFLQCRFIVS